MNAESLITKCGNCGTKNRIPVTKLNKGPICGKCGAPLTISSPGVPVNVTDQTFHAEVLSCAEPVLVDCWAPWCGPCRMVAPVLDQLASEYTRRMKIAKLNTDENPLTASKYGIQSIPTLLLFKNGNLADKMVGALPKSEIERHLVAVL